MVAIPSYKDLLWPVIEALRKLDGSGSIEEIDQQVLADQQFSEEQQQLQHGSRGRSELEYRLAWARTYLKGMGMLVNSTRGVWSLTPDGRTTDEATVRARHQAYVTEIRQERRARRSEQEPPGEVLEDGQTPDEPSSWEDELLEALLAMRPEQFERLSQRLLREAGFINTTVVGRSRDEGIDGIGLYRMSLVSFPVFFQCKRYSGGVGSRTVRDFRGAMVGRGDKGLLITTGTFTSDAKQEATRPGATPIDLIDGTRLAELLKKYQLGVRTVERTVEDVTVDHAFFREL